MSDREYLMKQSMKKFVIMIRIIAKLDIIAHAWSEENLKKSMNDVALSIEEEWRDYQQNRELYKYIERLTFKENK